MRQPTFKKSFRQTLMDNQKALDQMADMAGKPRIALYVPKPIKPRAKPSASGEPLEKDILAAIMDYLRACPKVGFVGRFNRGTAMTGDGNGVMRYTRFNTVKGFPDIHGMLKGGAAFYIECKRRGGKLSDDQREFIDKVTAAGGIAFMAESVTDVIERI